MSGAGNGQIGCRSIFCRVMVPYSFYSEVFFISKGHYSKNVYPVRVIIPNIFIPKGRYFKIQNNDPLG